MVLLLARWGRAHIPVAFVVLDPACRGPQTILLRQMLAEVVPPSWTHHVIVRADAGLAAHASKNRKALERVVHFKVLTPPQYIRVMVGSGTAKICMGADEALRQDRSLFKLKEHCVGQGAQNAVQCTERKWQHKLKQCKGMA